MDWLEDWHNVKIFKKGNPEQYNWTYPSVDIFLIEKEEATNRYVYTGWKTQNKWGRYTWWTQKEWDDVTDIEFGHITMCGLPKDKADRYLARSYGSRWSTTAVQTHSHEHRDNVINNNPERLRIDDFSPARHSKDPHVAVI